MGFNKKTGDVFDKDKFWAEEILTALLLLVVLPGLVLFFAVAFGVGG